MRRRTTERAKTLRREMSLPEVLLWRELKARPPSFRRQASEGGFVLDFYCPAARLALEIDGRQHEASLEWDAARDAALEESGITVRRIPAPDVLRDPEDVARACLLYAEELIASRKTES